ncbi:MAG: SpoIID/LytB domain-containing protein [Bacteroidales bacterium]
MNEPKIEVGILQQKVISFALKGTYTFGQEHYEGVYEVKYESGKILFEGEEYTEIHLKTKNQSRNSFTLSEVLIGKGFHWERKEDQTFRGDLKLIVENDQLVAINILLLEDYLKSVIASEMRATSAIELLKAHAVISRSWLMSQIDKRQNQAAKEQAAYPSDTRSEDSWIKWWDREDHVSFDVCADDHCQRYQGISRISAASDLVTEAVETTAGEVLMHDGQICDARYSKCCGGMLEEFQNCWEPVPKKYLRKVYDGNRYELASIPDLTDEVQARKWICGSPAAYCNTTDKYILSQVLNTYDQETTDFYRWKQVYDKSELDALIAKNTGIDFGHIRSFEVLERGTSGRVLQLKICGDKHTMTIGKELLIRKVLSETHLYSSAIVFEETEERWIIRGAGWGHGVGLCQIGAAVMAVKGYEYEDILNHYFPSAAIEKIY